MALINCPECGESISDKSTACPHCGLPSSYFRKLENSEPDRPTAESPSNRKNSQDFNYSEFRNLLLSFDKDYNQLITSDRYISGLRFPTQRKYILLIF